MSLLQSVRKFLFGGNPDHEHCIAALRHERGLFKQQTDLYDASKLEVENLQKKVDWQKTYYEKALGVMQEELRILQDKEREREKDTVQSSTRKRNKDSAQAVTEKGN